MADLRSLSNAQVILLAARFISDIDVQSLQALAAERRDVLTDSRIYRLLLTLYPNDETARSALSTLLRNIDSNFENVSALDGGLNSQLSAVTSLTPDLAAREARRLLISEESDGHQPSSDTLTAFVASWCRRIESTNGSLEDILPLVDEFAPSHQSLREWSERYLLPLARLQYQFYPDDESVPTLQELERLSGISAIHALLRCAEERSPQRAIARDLDQVVVPWIQGAADSANLDPWSDLNRWIFQTASKDFELAAAALLRWTPPEQPPTLKSHFAQAGLAVVYTTEANSDARVQTCKKILLHMSGAVGLESPSLDGELDVAESAASLGQVSETNLLSASLLADNNNLTHPSIPSISFLAGVLRTVEILQQYKLSAAISEIALICLHGSEDRQKQELRRILQQIPRLTSSMPTWETVRRQLLWLHSWSASLSPEPGLAVPAFLSRIAFDQIDEKLLDCMLAQGNHNAAKHIFLEDTSLPLPLSTAEERVVAAVYFAYDNASNGNRTRGGMKRAYDLLLAFRPSFPHSDQLRDIDYLIKATHSLSYYSLTLQHGVPSQPVNIRAQKDPLALVGRVLEQNTRAYTKLDDLLEIGRNLVQAHLEGETADTEGDDDAEDKDNVDDAQHKITYLAVTSALAAHDFDTAYSYITTRLSISPASGQASRQQDDTSWRAAYAAGRYKPNATPKSLHDRIAGLSKRMDLLSLALTLVPTAEPLSEILAQWRRCEEEMDSLKSQALDEERAFEMRGNGVIPGGFGMEDREVDASETRHAQAKRSMAGSSATYEEQAPMSLFDVASGAARALSRSTQGLRGGSLSHVKIRDSGTTEGPAGAISSDGGEENSRVRKRDMVSNMVTGGLVSGMSWVLGAQPASKEQDEYD